MNCPHCDTDMERFFDLDNAEDGERVICPVCETESEVGRSEDYERILTDVILL